MKEFKAACIDTNNIEELKNALSNGADETDMKIWGLSEREWVECINEAILELQSE